jgi:hypothetical protein
VGDPQTWERQYPKNGGKISRWERLIGPEFILIYLKLDILESSVAKIKKQCFMSELLEKIKIKSVNACSAFGFRSKRVNLFRMHEFRDKRQQFIDPPESVIFASNHIIDRDIMAYC